MSDDMPQRMLAGRGVGAIGLGCMSLSWFYDRANHPDAQTAVGLINSALDLGVTLLDTADVYGPFTNEYLVGRALRERGAHRHEATVATKVGLQVDGALEYHRNGRPEYIRGACDASLQRLGVERIDLYQLHRVDPAVAVEESIGAMAELVDAGKVAAIGVSEVDVATLERAHSVHPLAAVQSEFSLWTRDALDDGVLDWCAANRVAFLAFAPLGRGYLSGTIRRVDDLPADDWRRSNPRFTSEALRGNEQLLSVVEEIAGRLDATPAQVALAWLLCQGEHVIPIPGTKTPRHLEQNAAAARVVLGDADLERLTGLAPPVGSRY